jgi:hydrogenase-4 component F
MSLWLAVLIPGGAAILLALYRRHQARINLWATVLTCCATFLTVLGPAHTGPAFMLDAISKPFLLTTACIALCTAFSCPYFLEPVGQEQGGGGKSGAVLFYPLFQAFLFAMQLALACSNIGILWVALEGATLATVLLVAFNRTPRAVEAAWKYFVLCGVGIAQALFGTVLVAFAARQALDDPERAMNWPALHAAASHLDPTVMGIAFVFCLVGYGTKAGLVPLHQWLPDAYSAAIAPLLAMLSGTLLNVALYALLRIKMLTDAALATSASQRVPGMLLVTFGLASVLVAALLLLRQRDIKRLFGYSSIEHMGIATFALGLDTPLATFAALLHLLCHGLGKAALFIIVGAVTRKAGSRSVEQIRGLLHLDPRLGWAFVAAAAAMAGLPPFGLFVSEFLILTSAAAHQPGLAVTLALCMLIGFVALLRQLQPMVLGEASAVASPSSESLVLGPSWLQLGLVVILGMLTPPPILHVLREAAMRIITLPP